MIVGEIGLGITLLSLAIWVVLLCFRGQFWRSDRRLDVTATEPEKWPAVCAVIPARNEAEVLPATMRSILLQNYPGAFKIILVDDNSTDNTANIARDVADALTLKGGATQTKSACADLEIEGFQSSGAKLHIVSGEPLPSGWSGKLWAIEQGIRYAEKLSPTPDYFLLTDADIEHDRANLRQLVAKSLQEDLDLVSLMVLLRCESFWENILIPASVFFFQKLYPFRWVNNPKNNTAAAAGGCILIRREALTRVGGIQIVRQALIDDCALALAIKNPGKIWLGLTELTRSLRPYPTLSSIWDMVARTAFTQLNYSPLLLVGTVLGMTVIYIVPIVSTIAGILTGNLLLGSIGLFTWLLMAIAYFPTLQLYRCSPALSFCLPAIALVYTLMTLDSAWRHWRGRGGAWKGRVYPTYEVQ